jgi:iron complex outermembrane receptor protein
MIFIGRRRPFSGRQLRTRTCGFAGIALLAPQLLHAQATATDGSILEQVIVTARKLPEEISDVPMSVQALTGTFVENQGETSLYQLQFDVPGLVINNRGMFGSGFAIRGVSDDGGGTLSIAPHLNGVYLGLSNLALARMFDVEHIEIVKGPQGTLYGRNAIGGLINVVTRLPENEFDAELQGAIGSFNTSRIQGHVNLPAESLSVRLAFIGSEGDGYIRNSIDGRRFGEEDFFGVRGSLQLRPTTALTIDLTAQHVEDDGASGELWLPRKDYLPDPRNIHVSRVTLADPYLMSKDDFVSVDLDYDLGNTKLRSITGYARNVTRSRDDCAAFPGLEGCVRGVEPLRYEQRSQELRLESTGAQSIDWVIGAYYASSDEAQHFHTSIPDIAPVPLNRSDSVSESTAYAVFGQAIHSLGERSRLTGGLRFSRESNRVSSAGDGIFDNPSLTFAEGTWDSTSWRVGYEFEPNALTLLFASISTGFKSGGVTTVLLPNGEFDDYSPEKLLAFEVGITATLPGLRSRLRLSAFDYDYQDMQVHTVAVLADQIVDVIDNAAATEIYGLDLSATTAISSRVTFSGGLVWMPKREFVEFMDPLNQILLSGNKISRAPEWSVSSAINYRVPISSKGELSVSAYYGYRSEYFFTKENDPIFAQEGFGLLDVVLRFESVTDRWYAFCAARNVLDTDYFLQAFIQSSPGYPANYDLGFGFRF